MIVNVRAIVAPYTDVPTESLQAILRNHAHDRLPFRIGIRQLYEIMGELARRRTISEPSRRPVSAALEEFWRCYAPGAGEGKPSEEEVLRALGTPYELVPSPGGRECLGNGNWPGYECQCPGCDHYESICFPDWEGHKLPR